VWGDILRLRLRLRRVLCALCFVLCAWSLVLGPWSLVLGPWSLVLGPWSLVLGPWSLVLGAWCLVLGAWCLVLGPWGFCLASGGRRGVGAASRRALPGGVAGDRMSPRRTGTGCPSYGGAWCLVLGAPLRSLDSFTESCCEEATNDRRYGEGMWSRGLVTPRPFWPVATWR